MKKTLSLILAVLMCASAFLAFTACSDKRVGIGDLPDAYEVSYYTYDGRKNDNGDPIIYNITYGIDAQGNIYRNTTYNRHTELQHSEELNIKTTEGEWTYYEKNLDINKYEECDINTLAFHSASHQHLNYMRQGWVISNSLLWRDYSPSKIDASEVEAEDKIKTFLDSMNCEYYKYSKDGSDRFAIIAVEPESDLVLYYGDNNTDDDIYINRFVVTEYKTTQIDNYADLLK